LRVVHQGNLPTPARRKDRAPSEDQEYLLRICDDDPRRVARLIDEARQHNPGMTEAEAYRKAIRKVLRARPNSN